MVSQNNHRLPLVCLIIGFMTWVSPLMTHAENATDSVAFLHEHLLTIMKESSKLGYAGRYTTIEPVIDKTHDLSTITRLVMGRHWKSLTTTERSTLMQRLRELSIATYANHFDAFHGESFTILSETSLPRGKRQVVKSALIQEDGEEIRFTYTLHRVDEQWKIINIAVNGVSDLALKRTEYGTIMNQQGFPALLKKIESKIQELGDHPSIP